MTWNLEGKDGASEEGQGQRQKIEDLHAHVLVLTEATMSVVPYDLESSTSSTIPGSESEVRFAIVAASELRSLPLPELPMAAAALVTHDRQVWLVLGICMPWRQNAPPWPPGAAPPEASGPEAWLHVLNQLDLALHRLRSENPDLPVLVAGDFNQTLTGYTVGSLDGRERLRELLARHELVAFTEAAPSALPACPSVDHLCARTSAGDPIVWQANRTPSEQEDRLSDHAGYLVEVLA
jgi:hypothetical protein